MAGLPGATVILYGQSALAEGGNTMDEFIDVVHCSECGFLSMILVLTRCPDCGTVLGEIVMNEDEFFDAMEITP